MFNPVDKIRHALTLTNLQSGAQSTPEEPQHLPTGNSHSTSSKGLKSEKYQLKDLLTNFSNAAVKTEIGEQAHPFFLFSLILFLSILFVSLVIYVLSLGYFCQFFFFNFAICVFFLILY